MPNDFGVVTAIDSSCYPYDYIKILSDDTLVDNHNSLSMYFQYKQSGTYNWSNAITITPTISGNSFSVTNQSLGNIFNHNNEYVFRVITYDKFMQIGDYYIEEVVTKATPIIRIGDEFVQVNGDLLIGESSIVNQYSTSEVKTHKKWIDGKPIYRKIITGTLGNSIAHNIVNIDKILEPHGFYIGSGGNIFPIPSTRPGFSSYECGIYVNKAYVYFELGSSLGNQECYITLEYTKTTD